MPTSRMWSAGLRQLARGGRTDQPGRAALGMALALAGFLRAQRRPRKELLFSKRLREGETLGLRFVRGDTVVGETRVAGPGADDVT